MNDMEKQERQHQNPETAKLNQQVEKLERTFTELKNKVGISKAASQEQLIQKIKELQKLQKLNSQ